MLILYLIFSEPPCFLQQLHHFAFIFPVYEGIILYSMERLHLVYPFFCGGMFRLFPPFCYWE